MTPKEVVGVRGKLACRRLRPWWTKVRTTAETHRLVALTHDGGHDLCLCRRPKLNLRGEGTCEEMRRSTACAAQDNSCEEVSARERGWAATHGK